MTSSWSILSAIADSCEGSTWVSLASVNTFWHKFSSTLTRGSDTKQIVPPPATSSASYATSPWATIKAISTWQRSWVTSKHLKSWIMGTATVRNRTTTLLSAIILQSTSWVRSATQTSSSKWEKATIINCKKAIVRAGDQAQVLRPVSAAKSHSQSDLCSII